jgi:hypothetical protein
LGAFRDLSVEDRAKVIGGFIVAGMAIACSLVFIYVFAPEYRNRVSESVKSGSSIFTGLPFLLALLYLFFVLPVVFVGAFATGFLAKRSLGYVVKDILAPTLLMAGGMLLADALLFVLFGVLFSNLSVPTQALLMMFAFFVTAMTTAYVLKTKRAKNYLTKKTT